MVGRLGVRPEAEDELLEAALWYESERAGLGDEFLQSVRATLERIELSPLQFPAVTPSIRRALVSRFPFGVFFWLEEADTPATVLAIVHLHRDPATWQRRV